MKKLLVVGSGISGISISKMLYEYFDVNVVEKSDRIGGLIKCDRIDDNLFHRVGGHVFNSKNTEVLNWFWSNFNKDTEFISAIRNAKILINNNLIDYPIENHLYQLDEETLRIIIHELLQLNKNSDSIINVNNFELFLKSSFGDKLFDIYFGPYNKKIWNFDLKKIPLKWLNDKLPMPNVLETIINNICKKKDNQMVHSTFFYPINGGSQFIINRISEGLKITCSTEIESINFINNTLYVNNTQYITDFLVYTGDVRLLHKIIKIPDVILMDALYSLKDLPSNGTSNVFCKTDTTEISWLYLPDSKYLAHRIIYTGNFSDKNNKDNERKTCVVEFSGIHDKNIMLNEVKKLPGNLDPIAFNYEKNSYVIHENNSKINIDVAKKLLEKYNIFLLGRFAEWEYFNMDKCIEGALNLSNTLRRMKN
jgi:protoporphyrinogen oxidase